MTLGGAALVALVGLINAPGGHAQSRTRREFEVASIKPHVVGCGFAMLSFKESPGRFSQCGSLAAFIQTAYVISGHLANHQVHKRLQILGGPINHAEKPS